jgi:hypothetical protein
MVQNKKKYTPNITAQNLWRLPSSTMPTLVLEAQDVKHTAHDGGVWETLCYFGTLPDTYY